MKITYRTLPPDEALTRMGPYPPFTEGEERPGLYLTKDGEMVEVTVEGEKTPLPWPLLILVGVALAVITSKNKK